jgi:hypothetical protein
MKGIDKFEREWNYDTRWLWPATAAPADPLGRPPRWGRHAGTGQIIGVPDFRMDAELTCANIAGRIVTPA